MHVKNTRYLLKRGVAALTAALMLLQSPLSYVPTYASVSGNTIDLDYQTVSANSTETKVGELALNYAYIEHAQLEAGKQNILVSAGEGTVSWEAAQLTLVHAATGVKTDVALTDFTENVLHFSFETEGMQTGVYRVDELVYSYVENEVLYEGIIDFAQMEGMEQVCFGLGEENPHAQSEFTGYDADGVAEQLLDMNVVSLTGAEGNLSAANPVAEAVERAAAEATGSETVSAEKGNAKAEAEEVANERKVAGSYVVMLDPGHDATHAGARANGLKEEELTLKVAQYCKAYLEETYSDVVVYMSRPGAACPYPGTTSGDCNAKRVDDAYKKGADVYVSLHFNSTAGSTTTATGAIVFYPNSNYNSQAGSTGSALATEIIKQLAKLGLKNNGIQIRNSETNTTYPDGSLADYYGVIRLSKERGIPAVIVEHAFLNNASDAAFLKEEANLEQLGIADAMGIAQAYSLSTKAVVFSAQNLKVSEVDGGNGTFKMVLEGASPVNRIASIEFKVYPTANKKKAHTYTATLDDEKTGTYSAVGNVGEHGKLEGEYKVTAYALDAAGKKTQLYKTSFIIENGEADTEGMQVASKLNAKEKIATIKLQGASDVKDVYFMVYSTKKGEKSAKRYAAVKLANGQWRAKVKISDHKKSGEYVAKAYVQSYFGNEYEAVSGGFSVEGPTVKKLKVTKLNLTKGTFRIVVNGVESKSGVKGVSVIVKNSDGKRIRKVYTAKKAKAGYYYVDIQMKNFEYRFGTYEISAKVKDGNGIDEAVAKIKNVIEEPTPVIGVKLKNKQKKLVLTASNLGIGANVKGVRFKVVPVEKKKAAKTFNITGAKNGVYTKTVMIEDFGVSGNYKVLTYVKGANGKYKKVGKTQIINVPEVKGGTVKAKRKTDNASYLYVSDMEYKGQIKSVQVKAWPMSSKKAKYTYKAKLLANGSYRVLVNSKNHKGSGGEYKYQVIVTTANGITQTLLSGKITLGESTPDTDGLYAISGSSGVTVAQMMAYYKKTATYPSYYATTDAPTLKKFCQMYYDECEKEGIRVEVAFAQAMHETNYLRFGGDVSITQFNFAGIGATGGGAAGNSFASVQVGIRAQVQHLKAYANSQPLVQECVDPRFQYVTRGCAPYVEWLSIPNNPYGKGWATNPLYGTALRRMISGIQNS